MTWQLKGNGNACFLVNAASGIVLYEPDQPRDSKVLVTDSSLRHVNTASATKGLRVGSTAAASSHAGGEAEAIRMSTKALKKECNKKKNEARALERAMSMSRGEAAREKEEEEKVVKRVKSLSILDSKQELEEAECIQWAVELSKQEVDAENDAEAEFLRAMDLSRKEHELYKEQAVTTEEELLQQAMALSQQEYQRAKKNFGAGVL